MPGPYGESEPLFCTSLEAAAVTGGLRDRIIRMMEGGLTVLHKVYKISQTCEMEEY